MAIILVPRQDPVASDDAHLRAESQAPMIIALAVIFSVFSTITVTLRLYTRKFILDNVGSDDITIGVAQCLAIAVSISTILEAKWGLGRHSQFVSPTDAIKQLRCLFSIIILYNIGQIVTKISFLLKYYRLFPEYRLQRICYWLIVSLVVWGVIQEFLLIFSCLPIALIFPDMQGKCIPTAPVWYITTSMNVLTDFMIFIIPITPVLKLQIGVRQKIALLGLFCLGFFTCIISIVRMSTLSTGLHTKDQFWANAPTAYWTVIELNCGIICACLPTLRPLVWKFFPRFPTNKSHSRATGSSFGLRAIQNNSLRSEKGIYVQKEVQFYSTTALHSAISNDPTPIEGVSSEITIAIRRPDMPG